MRSHWFHLKEDALELRRNGLSITLIESELGVPRSTLYGWIKNIELSEKQKQRLHESRSDGWAKARKKALEVNRSKKALRMLQAKKEAVATLDKINLTPEILDLAFAMLYYGEGSKNGGTSLASSDKNILLFMLKVLRLNYKIENSDIRCELHLRADQDRELMKKYWSEALKLPLTCFRYVTHDQRTQGRPTYENYYGVCVVNSKNIAIKRKMMYLYSLFCDKVSELNLGA